MDSKIVLQEAEKSLQETWAKLKETEKLEEKETKQPQEEERTEKILEPTPQPSLGTYYNLLEAGKIIPHKFAVPLFFAVEEERIRTHTLMRISKSILGKNSEGQTTGRERAAETTVTATGNP